MSKTYDTFIFDLDGTLIDTVPDLMLLSNKILRELGYPEHTMDEIISYIGNGVKALIALALPPDAPQEDHDEFHRRWREYFPEYYSHSFPYPGMVQFLTQIKEQGCKVAVVSNKFQQGVEGCMNFALPGFFKVMYGESPETPKKPDPAGIIKAMEDLGSTPDTTVYVGDSPGDVLAGQNAGCDTVAALWGYRKEEDFIEANAIPTYFMVKPLDLLPLASK